MIDKLLEIKKDLDGLNDQFRKMEGVARAENNRVGRQMLEMVDILDGWLQSARVNTDRAISLAAARPTA